MVGAVAAATTGLLFAVTAACDSNVSGDRGRAGKDDTGLRSLPAPLGITRTPASWHIVYRFEEELDAEGGPRVSTDKVWVRRPFDSLLETWSGPPPGKEVQVRQLATFTRRTNGEVTLEIPPAVAASDIRLTGVLDAALAHGVLERPGLQKTIAGRRCEVFRSGQLLSATVLQRPEDDDYGESCVDEAGLVLEELLVSGGERLSRRTAVSVEEDVALGDELFPVKAGTAEVTKGGGRSRLLVPGNRPPGEFFELDGPVEGFELRGRWSVVPPQPENFVALEEDPQAHLRRRAAVVDVWVRGVDVVFVEQGGTVGGAPPYSPTEGAPAIDLGPTLTAKAEPGSGAEGEVVLSAQEVAVRILLSGGRYVRVAGTLTPPELAAIAKRLTPQPGGELDFADD